MKSIICSFFVNSYLHFQFLEKKVSTKCPFLNIQEEKVLQHHCKDPTCYAGYPVINCSLF